MITVGVIGTGSMGSLFAARLSKLAEVTMFGSWLRQLDTINRNGLTLVHPDGEISRHEIRAVRATDEFGEVRLALILVKGWQTEQAAELAARILNPDGLAMTLQNGIGNLETIERQVGLMRSVLGVTSEGATMIKPGVVRHAGSGTTHIAVREETASGVNEAAELFRNAGFETHLVDDAEGLVWGKLAVNAGINPLTALLQVPNGFLVEDMVARRLMEGAAEETAQVAHSQGIVLPYPSASGRVLEVARMTAANRSSMVQDVARGTPTEIESITGAVVRVGEQYSVSTPINQALLLLMRSLLNSGDWRAAVGRVPEHLINDFTYLAQLSGQDDQSHH